MDLDNVAFRPVEPSSPLPTAGSNSHFVSHQQLIPDDDFILDIDPGTRPGSPVPYDEDLEGSALEEELRAFEGIQYGLHSVQVVIC